MINITPANSFGLFTYKNTNSTVQFGKNTNTQSLAKPIQAGFKKAQHLSPKRALGFTIAKSLLALLTGCSAPQHTTSPPAMGLNALSPVRPGNAAVVVRQPDAAPDAKPEESIIAMVDPINQDQVFGYTPDGKIIPIGQLAGSLTNPAEIKAQRFLHQESRLEKLLKKDEPAFLRDTTVNSLLSSPGFLLEEIGKSDASGRLILPALKNPLRQCANLFNKGNPTQYELNVGELGKANQVKNDKNTTSYYVFGVDSDGERTTDPVFQIDVNKNKSDFAGDKSYLGALAVLAGELNFINTQTTDKPLIAEGAFDVDQHRCPSPTNPKKEKTITETLLPGQFQSGEIGQLSDEPY